MKLGMLDPPWFLHQSHWRKDHVDLCISFRLRPFYKEDIFLNITCSFVFRCYIDKIQLFGLWQDTTPAKQITESLRQQFS